MNLFKPVYITTRYRRDILETTKVPFLSVFTHILTLNSHDSSENSREVNFGVDSAEGTRRRSNCPIHHTSRDTTRRKKKRFHTKKKAITKITLYPRCSGQFCKFRTKIITSSLNRTCKRIPNHLFYFSFLQTR